MNQVIIVVGLLRTVIPLDVLQMLGAGALIAFAAYRVGPARPPRWVGIRVGFQDAIMLAGVATLFRAVA